MKNNKFRGWFDVYKFTFSQTAKKVSFCLATFLVALVILVGCIGINVVQAILLQGEDVGIPEEYYYEEFSSEIETVYVLDRSGLPAFDYVDMLEVLGEGAYNQVEFHYIEETADERVISAINQEENYDVLATITKEGSDYVIKVEPLENSRVSIDDYESMANVLVSCFDMNKIMIAGITEEELMLLMGPVETQVKDIGEEESLAVILIQILAPMIFGFILYFMLIFHGQTITLEVSTEKTSKLMETLLTTIHPYALIMGKVLAISSVAIVQFLIWILSVFVGLFGGNVIAQGINPEYSNSIVEIIVFLRDTLGESAMTMEAVILAIVIFCVGFVFYCVIAGLAGCMVSRPEDTATFQSLFQFPVIISFFVCYFGAMAENQGLLAVARYIPFTAPFSVPVDLMTGTMSILQGIISCLVLIVFSIVVIMISARIYKGLVLYNGQRLSVKKIISIVRNNTN